MNHKRGVEMKDKPLYLQCYEIIDKLVDLDDGHLLGDILKTMCCWSVECQEIFIQHYNDVLTGEEEL